MYLVEELQETIIPKRELKGSSPLMPIQSWFFNKMFPAPHHYNQSVLLKPSQFLNRTLLEKSLNLVFCNHDSFLLRYRPNEQGWEQFYPDNQHELLSFEEVDLSARSDEELPQAVENIGDQLNGSLNISDGPVIKTCLIQCGERRGQRLLIASHHLVVDAVSYRILIEELEATYRHLKMDSPSPVFASTTTFQDWGIALNNLVNSGFFDHELDYWLNVPETNLLLPSLAPKGEEKNIPLKRQVSSLDASLTEKLLKRAPQAYQTEINDLLLSSLILATKSWTGNDGLYVYFEGHGREELVEGIDLSRTTGWFTSLYPIYLTLSGEQDLGEILKNTKEQLRKVPNKGIGYGLLRYLRKDCPTAEQLQDLPEPNISFNYLGQLDTDKGLFRVARESFGQLVSSQNQRKELIDIHALVVSGRLIINWYYCPAYFKQKEMLAFIGNYQIILENLIQHCCTPNSGGATSIEKITNTHFTNTVPGRIVSKL